MTIADVKNALEFINLLKTARLDESVHSGLSKANVKRLRDPPRGILEINDPLHLLSIDIYLGLGNSAEKAYTMVRAALMRHSPEQVLLSLHQVKQKIEQLSGIIPIVNDMCVNSCIAYTGPHTSKDRCSKCKQPRYMERLDSSGKKVPRKQFSTIPLGQQLQALKRSPEGAESMEYLSKMVEEVLEELNTTGELKSFDDVSHGSRIWGAYAAGDIGDNDIVVMMSIDGAQLYRNKKSDCWIYIWVVLNLGPDKRYRKRYVLPGGVIPGPNHPQDLDSFLFPGFYHVSALMQEGLNVWDAHRDERQLVALFVAMGLADGPAMALLAGTVGLTGRRGCRLYCPLTGRHKPRCGTYYPLLLKPEGYNVRGCMHGDVHPADLDVDPDELAAEYLANLARLIEAPNQKEYERLRLETGLTKPSIFSGLSRTFALPGCFPLDFMHLAALNLTILFFALWRGTIKGGKKTDPASFPWAVFADVDDPDVDYFRDFGREVARASPWLPGSYDRPPRDLSEKINSGYKAQEWETLFYGYGPAMLRRWLPFKYWQHYCMLVRAARLLGLCSITADELCEAQDLGDRMAIEFEVLYCMHDPDLLHHCRPCVHAFTHGAREVKKTGPLPGHTQKPMERTIGNLGEEIKLPSDACANIAQRAILRCQKCAITGLVPGLAEVFDKSYELPDSGIDLGGGYSLLRARERTPHYISDVEAAALDVYLEESGCTLPLDSLTPLTLKVQRWARLRLPNGQIVRSRFAKAEQQPLQKIRIARIAKVGGFSIHIYSYKLTIQIQLIINGEAEIGEVLYYCRIPIHQERRLRTVAVVSLFGARQRELYSTSHKTVWLSEYLGEEAVRVVDVACIQSLAAMVPDSDVKIDIEDQKSGSQRASSSAMSPAVSYSVTEEAGVRFRELFEGDATCLVLPVYVEM